MATWTGLLFLLLYAPAVLGSGRFLLRRFGVETSWPDSARWSLEIALGSGGLAVATAGLAHAGLARPPFLWGFLVLTGAAGLHCLAKLRFPPTALAVTTLSPGAGAPGWIERIGPAALGVVFLLNLAACLAPPANYDSLMYHLAVPRIHLEAGGIVERPDLVLSYACGHLHMLFLLGLGTAGEPACAGIVALANLGLLLGLLGAARHSGLKETAWVAPLALLATPFFGLYGKNLEVDLALAHSLVLALLCFQQWMRDRALATLALTAVLAGLAGGFKYTGYLGIPFLLTARIWLELRSGEGRVDRRLIRDLALLVAVPILVNLPLLLRNALWTGNPLYPYLSGVFGGSPVAGRQASNPGGLRLADFPSMTWNLFVRDLRVGPIFAIFLPALVLARPRPAHVALGLGLAALALPVLFLLCPSYWRWNLGRFQAPFLVPLCVAVAVAFTGLLRSGRGLRAAAIAFLCANLLLGIALFAGATVRRLPAALGFETREAYLARELPAWRGWQFLNREVPPGVLIGLVDPISYYVRPPFEVLESYHVHLNLDAFPDAGSLRDELRRRGISYLAVTRDRRDINTLPFWEFIERHPDLLDDTAAERVFADEAYQVFRLR